MRHRKRRRANTILAAMIQARTMKREYGTQDELEDEEYIPIASAQATALFHKAEASHLGNYRLKKQALFGLQKSHGNRFVSQLISNYEYPDVQRQSTTHVLEETEEAEVSPTYAARSEGGWISEASGCAAEDQTKINTAMNRTNTVVGTWNLPNLTRVKNTLSGKLSTITIDCHGGGCEGLYAHAPRGGSRITVCQMALDASQNRLNAVVFHELIHSCGGTELDAEALENHFFSGSGATAPSRDDFEKFNDDGGNFTIWDGSTGQVFEKKTDGTRGNALSVTAASFQGPTPSGGW